MLKPSYPTIDHAEEAFDICYFGSNTQLQDNDPVISTPKQHLPPHCPLSPVFDCSPSKPSLPSNIPGNIISNIIKSFGVLTKLQRVQLLQELFTKHILTDINPNITQEFFPKTFTSLIAKGLDTLFKNKKENLFLNMGKCFGSFRDDGSPRLPIDNMPFGLISHNLKFFSCDDGGNIHAPEDYKSWMQTMYSRFGQSWAALHLGPMWAFENSSQNKEQPVSSTSNVDVLAMALEESGLLSTFSETSVLSVPAADLSTTSMTAVSDDSNVIEDSSNSGILVEPERKSYSTLWSRITKDQAEELLDAEVSVIQVEEMHAMRPVVHRGETLSYQRKPMQVGKIIYVYLLKY